jgi:hypothetical protein
MSPLVPYTEKGMNFSGFNEEPYHAPQSLLYAVYDEIRLHLFGEDKEYLITECRYPVDALAIHDNRLVHAENRAAEGTFDGFIVRTETNERVAERPRKINALAVYKDRLIDAGNYDEIRYTQGNVRMARRTEHIEALAIHDGRLVDVENRGKDGLLYHQSFYTKPKKLIEDRPSLVSSIVSHDDRLVHAENLTSSGNYRSGIFHTGTGKIIADRPNWINALAVYNGRLIDTGDYKQILFTDTGESIVDTERGVSALLPIGEELADRLLTLPEVRELK